MAHHPERSVDGLSLSARITLLFVTPLSALALAGLGPVLPQISAYFASVPNSAVLVRLLLTCVGGVMAIGAPIAGSLGDRFGQRRVLLIGLFLYGLLGGLGYLINDLHLLLLSRLAFGIAQTVIGVIPVTIIVSWLSGPERDKWVGFTSMTGTIGGLVLIGAAGVVGQHGWPDVFLFYLLAFPALAVAAMTLPRGGHFRDREIELVGAGPRRGRWWQIVLLGLVCGSVVQAATIFLPFRMAEIGIVAPEKLALALLPPTITGTLTAFAYGYIRRYLSIAGVFVLAFAVCAVAFAAIAVAHTLSTVIVFQLLFGVGLGFLAPNLFTLAGLMASQAHRAKMVGYANAGFFGGPLLVQLPLEPLSHAYGADAPIVALMVIAALGALGSVLALARVGHRTSAPLVIE